MRKKKEKSTEQITAEEYFPVDERDLRYAIEKQYKPLETEFIQTSMMKPQKERKKFSKPKKRIGVNRTSSKFAKKKFSKSSKQIKEYKPQKIILKKDGYELIVTEKPQAAMKIADSLGRSEKRNLNGIPYYEVNRGGNKIVVACAVGHLFTLSQNERGSTRDPANADYTRNRSGYPVFDISWVPNYMVKKADFTKKYYDTLLSLAKNAGSITVATDYDIEGEVIGLNVVRFICSQKDANRMKFSTLTKPELNVAYETKNKSINWGQAIAGETRHYLDWFYGINLSRALMNSIKEAGRFKIMSIGRVQGPALNLIVERERKIQEFKSQTYWQVFITVKNSHEIELKYNKDIFNKKELEQFENLIGKTAIASTSKKEEFLPPNPPFNLTSLQMEAYRIHGFTPARTLQIAQSLYLNGLISYPRTSSQKLPDSIDYKEILTKLAKQYRVESLIKRNKPVEGKKSDPAHPSIYPTGEFQNLSGEEEKIYNLIAKRFLSLFCEDAIIDNKTITAKYNNLIFNTKGSEVRRKAWLEIYPYKIKETQLPDFNGEVKIIDLRTEEKETQPPKRYSPASIVSELEKRNLGTKCLTGDTKIILNNNAIPISEVFSKSIEYSKEKDKEIRLMNKKTTSLNLKGKLIITEPKFISRRKINENEKIIEIKTDASAIKVTENHLIYVHRNKKIEQIPAKELKLSDRLIGLIRRYEEGKEVIKKTIFNNNYRIKNNEILHKFSSKGDKGILINKFPIRWSTSLAWLLGYYYGDGSYNGPECNGSHNISFSTTEKKALKLLEENVKIIFGNSTYNYNLGTKYKINLNAVMAYALINTFPELNGKKPFNIPKEFIGDFLRGFFDADGNVHLRPEGKTKIKKISCNSYNTPRVKMTLGNKKLITWISELLNELGIKNKINKGFASCNEKKFDCWTILISERDKIEKFAYKIGFDSYKQSTLYNGLNCNSPKYKILQNSTKIVLSLIEKAKDIQILSKETNLNFSQVKYALQRLQRLNIVTKKKKNQYEWNFFLKVKNEEYVKHCMKITYHKINENIYKIPIKQLSIKEYQDYVYDISIKEDSPNFITEGNILIHNSTRASIVETLYDRGYIKERSIEATQLGMSLISTLEKYSPVIIDENLTRKFEKGMDSILESKKNFEDKEKKMIEEAKETIRNISQDFEKNKGEIGKELVSAEMEIQKQNREENKLVLCPLCKKGTLAITYSKKNRRHFIACNAYPECRNTYSLPPNGLIKKTDKTCESCGFPMLMSLRKAKRPWEFCFNKDCPTNKKRLEEYREKKEEENSENLS